MGWQDDPIVDEGATATLEPWKNDPIIEDNKPEPHKKDYGYKILGGKYEPPAFALTADEAAAAKTDFPPDYGTRAPRLPNSKNDLQAGQWYNIGTPDGGVSPHVWNPDTNSFYDFRSAKMLKKDDQPGVSWTDAMLYDIAGGNQQAGLTDRRNLLTLMDYYDKYKKAPQDYPEVLRAAKDLQSNNPKLIAQLNLDTSGATALADSLANSDNAYQRSLARPDALASINRGLVRGIGSLQSLVEPDEKAKQIRRGGAALAGMETSDTGKALAGLGATMPNLIAAEATAGSSLAGAGASFTGLSAAQTAEDAEGRADELKLTGAAKAAYIAGHTAVDAATNAAFIKAGAPIGELLKGAAGEELKAGFGEAIKAMGTSVAKGIPIQVAGQIGGQLVDAAAGQKMNLDIPGAVKDAAYTQSIFGIFTHLLAPAAQEAIGRLADKPTWKNVYDATGVRAGDATLRDTAQEAAKAVLKENAPQGQPEALPTEQPKPPEVQPTEVPNAPQQVDVVRPDSEGIARQREAVPADQGQVREIPRAEAGGGDRLQSQGPEVIQPVPPETKVKPGGFARLLKELPRDDVHQLLTDSGAELTNDDRLIWRDKRDFGQKIGGSRKAVVEWLLGRVKGDDPATYAPNDPEWMGLLKRAREIITGVKAPTPTEVNQSPETASTRPLTTDERTFLDDANARLDEARGKATSVKEAQAAQAKWRAELDSKNIVDTLAGYRVDKRTTRPASLGEAPPVVEGGGQAQVAPAHETQVPSETPPTGEPLHEPQAAYSAIPGPLAALPIEKIDAAVKQLGDQVLKLVAPQRRGPEAYKTSQDLREYGGKLAQARDQFSATYGAARAKFEGQPPQENIDRIQAAQTGKLDPKDPLDKVLISLQDNQKKLLAEFERVKPGITDGWMENYFRQQWKDPNAAQKFLESWYSKRPLQGKKSILKPRTFPTIKDGIAAGLEPITTNPVELMEDAYVQSHKYILGQDVKAALDADKRIVFSPSYKGAPDGWTALKDPMFQVWSRGENGERILRGNYYAPDEVATVINNFQSRPLESYNKAFSMLHQLSHLQTMAQLGISTFHATMTALQSATTSLATAFRMVGRDPLSAIATGLSSPVAHVMDVWRGKELRAAWLSPELATPEMRTVMEAYRDAGGRAFFDQRVRLQFSKKLVNALKEGNVIEALKNAPFTALEQFARPILEFEVPMAKGGAFYRMFSMWKEANPDAGLPEIRDAATKMVNSIDNRFGEVTHDNTMTQGIVRSLENFSLRAFQYTAGTLREHAGAAKDVARQVGKVARLEKPELTDRMAYVMAEATIAALTGAAFQYALTGKKPENTKDLFFPRDGGMDAQGNETRLRIPGYINDLVSIWHDPKTALEHKLNPFISTISQLIHNKDFYGEQIHGEGGQGTLPYLAKQALPFSVQNLIRESQTGGSKVLPFVGIGVAPGYITKSAAQQAVQEWYGNRGEQPPIPAEKFEATKEVRSLTQGARMTGDFDTIQSELAKKEAAGEITKRQHRSILKRAAAETLVNGIQGMPFEDAINVWNKATPEEKSDELRAALRKKLKSQLKSRPPMDRDKLLTLADSAGIM